MHGTDHIKHTKHALRVCGTWGTYPPRKMFDCRPEITYGAVFGGETARVGQPTANLVIVFETINARTI